ncbi:MAG: hypothetical protein ACTSUO_00855 [Candidatus Thorarchaeota archaeon]
MNTITIGKGHKVAQAGDIIVCTTDASLHYFFVTYERVTESSGHGSITLSRYRLVDLGTGECVATINVVYNYEHYNPLLLKHVEEKLNERFKPTGITIKDVIHNAHIKIMQDDETEEE